MIKPLKRQSDNLTESKHKKIRLCLNDNDNRDPYKYQLLDEHDPDAEFSRRTSEGNDLCTTLRVIEVSENDIPDEISFIPIEDGQVTYYEFGNIGRGAFGNVNKIIDIKSEKQFALKRSNDHNSEHIIYEAYVMWGLVHENIVQFNKLILGRNECFEMVMECCETTLEEIIPQIPIYFESGQMLRCFHQILKGIEYLHCHLVIHRDLKPSNILVSRDNILKIGDFGMAKRFYGHEGYYGVPVCTLNYRPPELLSGSGKYGSKIDMWSIGCIFGEIIYKKVMFTGLNDYYLLCNIFKKLGTPNETELPEIKMVKELYHVPNFHGEKNKFKSELGDAVYDLLFGLLEFNREKRLSADEALNSSCFDVL